MGNAHQPHPTAQVILQGPGDAVAQIGFSRLVRTAARGGTNKGLTGHQDQILPFHQREQAPGQGGCHRISKGQMLQHHDSTGLDGQQAGAMRLP